ncbi:MAG: sodium-dependent transporter [Prolixibacteraceae bacterium]|nr:sodium-dependent transporter [Prolixibacteraceae bacterium]
MSDIPTSRDSFGSKFGVIAAAAGSAVGLGNIWKFPYIVGVYGGAAFLFVYLAFILAVGMPIMLSELIIGRSSKRNAFGAFKVLAPGTPWKYIGIIGVAAAFLILSFYGVVAGWSVEYIVLSLKNGFANRNQEEIATLFSEFNQATVKPLAYQFFFMLLTAAIVIVGVKKGIEKYTKILMPVLIIILLTLCAKALTLDGAKAGLEFLFKPDFSKLTGDGILSALGHAFFTLSLGMGTLITYGSYIDKKNNLANIVLNVTVADTVIAILAGVAIFPAVFAFGIAPSEGPGLIFITLPNIFSQMSGGYLFSILFFILLTVAALTSAISILEVVVAYFKEEFNMSRKISTILATILISILGVFCSLSMGDLSHVHIFGLTIFDAIDWVSANLFLPIGGLFISLFVGWYLGYKKVKKELANGSTFSGLFVSVFIFLVKFVSPIAIAVVMLNKIGLLQF